MQLHFDILNSNSKGLLRTANSLLNNIKKIPINAAFGKILSFLFSNNSFSVQWVSLLSSPPLYSSTTVRASN